MENIALSPTMSMKLKNRESVNKIKHGSPKLQEVLRERCRQRMREKRGQLFNRTRFGIEINSKDVQDTLTEIVRKELNIIATTDLDPTVNPFSHIVSGPLDPEEALELETEIINEEEQWILQEYETMSQEELELLALAADQEVNEVICPTCQVSNLTEEVGEITCTSCTFKLNNITLKDLDHLISKSVNTHSAMCTNPPGFLPLAGNSNVCLCLICDKCSTLTPVT
ncbi:RPA-interacting protein [Dufourea novaeangliae]|uniref:RPA-interacting protein n=2 Tax=Dufourea novaeangliae TaxID=178035 RepID=A0A154PPT1_DUFNO|nr:RPA-interacting protein [Dufourea novaeangliae]